MYCRLQNATLSGFFRLLNMVNYLKVSGLNNSDIDALAADLDGSTSVIIERVAIGLAVERDPETALRLSEKLATPIGPRRRVILIDESGPAIYVDDAGTVCGTCVFRPASLENAHKTLFGSTTGQLYDVRDFLIRTGAWRDASALVGALLTDPTDLDRTTFLKLHRWRDLFAVMAYGWVTTASIFLDAARLLYKRKVALRQMNQRQIVNEYHNLVHGIGAMMCLACAASDKEWLTELASTLPWVTWTPSYILSRERSLLSVLQGATCASAFGAQVIDRYVQRLRDAESQIEAFDAVLGLVAVAHRHTTNAEQVRIQIGDALAAHRMMSPENGATLEALRVSAFIVLRTPDVGTQFVKDWIASEATGSVQATDITPSRLLETLRSYADGAQLVEGYFPAILAIPLFEIDQPEQFYMERRRKTESSSRKTLSDATKALMRSNTTLIDACGKAATTVH